MTQRSTPLAWLNAAAAHAGSAPKDLPAAAARSATRILVTGSGLTTASMEALPHSPTDVAHAVVNVVSVPTTEALAVMPRRDPAATHELVTRDAEPAGVRPPRKAMRLLLQSHTDVINRTWYKSHPDQGFWLELRSCPECPWRDYIATLPSADKAIACGEFGILRFGVASFPDELDPNTGCPRVDFQAWHADGSTHVRLHLGKTASGDATPVVCSTGSAVQGRLNYTARVRGRPL